MNAFTISIIISSIIVFVAIMIDIYDRNHPKNISGFIVVDKSDPDGPYMFLELGEHIDIFCEREVAAMGIIVRDPNSQD